VNFSLSFGDISAIAGLCSLFMGAGLVVLKAILAQQFVDRREVQELALQLPPLRNELAQIRERMAGVVSHADLGKLFDRLSQVEREQAKSGAFLESVLKTTDRTDRRLETLMEATIQREKNAA